MSPCPSCASPVGPKVRFCPACGSTLEPSRPTVGSEVTESKQADATCDYSAAKPLPDPPPHAVEHSQSALVPSSPASLPKEKSPADAVDQPPVQHPVSAPSLISSGQPIGLGLRFPHTLVAGHPSIVVIRIETSAPTFIDLGEITLESNSLAGLVIKTFRNLVGGDSREFEISFEPARAGHAIIQIGLMINDREGRRAYRGSVSELILGAPENHHYNINIGDIQSNSGSGANQGLGADYRGNVNISNLLGDSSPQFLNDLLRTERDKTFRNIPLELDYGLSAMAVDSERLARERPLRLPREFIGQVQPCNRCVLQSVGDPDGSTISLVATPEFRLGRNRSEVDLATWWWPRSKTNDELTRRISQVQVRLAADRQGIVLWDPGSANGSLFDGQPLAVTDRASGNRMTRRASLSLAHEYGLDVEHLDGAYANGPAIQGIDRWGGPPKASAPVLSGSVNFTPTSCRASPFAALWIFTDASFGSSAANALTLSDPKQAEVQGRFHWFRDCFWIESIATNNAIRLNDRVLYPGEIVPLTSGMNVRLGTQAFRVECG